MSGVSRPSGRNDGRGLGWHSCSGWRRNDYVTMGPTSGGFNTSDFFSPQAADVTLPDTDGDDANL